MQWHTKVRTPVLNLLLSETQDISDAAAGGENYRHNGDKKVDLIDEKEHGRKRVVLNITN